MWVSSAKPLRLRTERGKNLATISDANQQSFHQIILNPCLICSLMRFLCPLTLDNQPRTRARRTLRWLSYGWWKKTGRFCRTACTTLWSLRSEMTEKWNKCTKSIVELWVSLMALLAFRALLPDLLVFGIMASCGQKTGRAKNTPRPCKKRVKFQIKFFSLWVSKTYWDAAHIK